jgi:Leucine-rich repeat (LRR) protein
MLSRRSILVLLGAPAISRASDDAWILKLGGQVRRDSIGDIIEVNLRGRWVSAAEILELLQYKKLVRLNLSHTRIADPDLLYLRPATQIEDLNLAYSEHITDIGMSVIKDWKNLKRLDVSGTQTADGALALLGRLGRLESLDVAGSEVTDDGIQELLPLTDLKHLGLGRSQLGEGAIEVLGLLDNLQSLDLSSPAGRRNRRRGGGDRIAQGLVDAIARLRDLRILRIGHSGVDSSALRPWASSLQKLERLGLENCTRIDDSAMPVISGWKSLKQLDLQGTKVTPTALELLRKSRPDLNVLSVPGTPSGAGQ